MKRLSLVLSLLVILFAFSGCASMSSFYDPWFEDGVIPEECFLKAGEEPKVYYSDDFDSDIYYLQSNYYLILGKSSYNGPADASLKKAVASLCKEKRAEIGLYGYQYTGTKTGAYSSGSYINTYSVPRYDYDIYLFVPMPEYLMLDRARVGLRVRDLDSSDRLSTKRNVGAYVSLVYDSTPAFYSNISRGDIISEINGITITSADQVEAIFDKAISTDTLRITLYRGGLPFTVEISPLF